MIRNKLALDIGIFLAVLVFSGIAQASVINTIGFEDLGLRANSYWNGLSGTTSVSPGYFVSGASSHGFSGGTFSNYATYYPDWDYKYWCGWAYSSCTDRTTGDFTNQFSAYAGSGYNSSTYAIGYSGSIPTTITLPTGTKAESAMFTNTTYAALIMSNGNKWAKKFGGDSGNDKDWFLLTITGTDASGNKTGTVNFYLADYRFDDNSKNYIISDWTLVDLTALGNATTLTFTLTSSDVNSGYINTPTYFAMDDLIIVPEPSALALLAVAAMGFIAFARRCRKQRSL